MQLLAEGLFDIPSQAIIFILVAIFSVLKWLFEKISERNLEKNEEEKIEDLYDLYRDEIRARQTAPHHEGTPIQAPSIPQPQSPPLPQPTVQPAQDPAPFLAETPRFTQADIERARALKQQATAYNLPSSKKEQKRRRSTDKKKLIHQLQDKNSLRQALIVREILGPPKALESSQL